ncbi:MAG: NAD(P)-dependent oxidoreductase [Prevotellaceae bacterium]|jgi:nucleoside-diphosphate-sugar epimerase|nr:NAD(P)-dependent oxidoreductase [Prevotellaceae bacterium]
MLTTAIVTGATGFVGTHLRNELVANGVEVTALCRENSLNISRLPQEIAWVYSLDDVPAADVFYHLAWQDASGAGRQNAAVQSENVTLALNALNAAYASGCKRFVILGTVYEKFADTVRKRRSYGGSDFYILCKDLTHALTNQLAYKLGIEYTYVQICHPFGKFVKPEQMLANVIGGLLDGKAVELGPGTEYYDIVAVEDLVCGLRLAGESDNVRREYYIGSGNPRLLRDYLTEARRVLGVDTPLNFGARPHDGLHFQRKWFNISDAKHDLSYSAKLGFEKMVKGYIENG